MSEETLNIDSQSKETYGQEYDKHLFEQYKLYVQMADQISSRRMLANSFFLGVHTALVTAFTVLLKEKILVCSMMGYFPFIAVFLLCYMWYKVIKSYKQLNSAKFKVIHLIESRLPIAPYDVEWNALGRGEDPKLYKPLTHVEKWIPFCFFLLYLFLAIGMAFNPNQ